MVEENKARIPVTPTVKQIVKDYTNGLGVTYSQAMVQLIQAVCQKDETPFEAGRRMQETARR